MPCDESLLLEKDALSLTEAQGEVVFQAHSRSLERSTTASFVRFQPRGSITPLAQYG
jgi:hypothetical protein